MSEEVRQAMELDGITAKILSKVWGVIDATFTKLLERSIFADFSKTVDVMVIKTGDVSLCNPCISI